MPSFFLTLEDGRCVARRYTGYDYLIELAMEEMKDDGEEGEFKAWLRTRIPSEGDLENGFGGFIKPVTHENIMRNLDFILKRMLRMRRLIRIKDHPDNLSDWIKGHVTPPTGAKVGPGW